MKKRFDEILNECIRELEVSGGNVESVLALYPEHAEELRPHLEIWASLSAVEKAEASPHGATRGRQQLLTAVAKAGEARRTAGLIGNLTAKGGLSMRFVAVFVAGAALALGVTFLTGNLDFGGGSSAEAQIPHPCLESLDLNGDGSLTVEDVLLFKTAIRTQDLAYDYNSDGVVDIHDAVAVIREVIDCLRQQQPPPLP